MIGDQPRALHPSGSSTDDVEVVFATVALQAAELVAQAAGAEMDDPRPCKEYFNMAITARRPIWKRQKADTHDSHLKRTVHRANTCVQRVWDAEHARFLKKHVQGLEEVLRQRDLRRVFQHIKSLSVKDMRKACSQYIPHEEGRMLRDPDLSLER